MENKSHALAAGLFVLVLGAALAAVALWFNKDDHHALVPYIVTTTGDVSGLKPEAPVRYRGVDVGKVAGIQLSADKPGVIEVRIGVDPLTPVTTTTWAQLGYLGVTGITFISLQDRSADGPKLASSADKPAAIAMRPSLMEGGENMIASVGELLERANALLSEENRNNVTRLLASSEQASSRVARLAERLEPVAGQMTGLLADARGLAGDARAMVGDARSTLGAVKAAAVRADELGGTLSQLALKLDTRVTAVDRMASSAEDVGQVARVLQEETVPRLNALADGLQRQTRSLDRVMRTLSEQPQSLVFGNAPSRAGPGEAGFSGGAR